MKLSDRVRMECRKDEPDIDLAVMLALLAADRIDMQERIIARLRERIEASERREFELMAESMLF